MRELSRASGLGISTVREILHARSDPTLMTLLAVCDALHLKSLDELLGPTQLEQLQTQSPPDQLTLDLESA